MRDEKTHEYLSRMRKEASRAPKPQPRVTCKFWARGVCRKVSCRRRANVCWCMNEWMGRRYCLVEWLKIGAEKLDVLMGDGMRLCMS